MVNSPSRASCSLSHNASYPASLRVKPQFPYSRYALGNHYHAGEPVLAHTPPESAKDHRTVALTPTGDVLTRCRCFLSFLPNLLAALALVAAARRLLLGQGGYAKRRTLSTRC
jgi:hypothetical protein